MIKAKAYPTLVEQVLDSGLHFGISEGGKETTELITSLNTWRKDRRFVISRTLKDERDRAQLSFLDGEEYAYSFYVTNTGLSPGQLVDFYQKRGNSENYIKEAKYDMAVG